jgi:flagellar biosynthesis protein FliP
LEGMTMRKILGVIAAGIALLSPVPAIAGTRNTGLDLGVLGHNGGSVPWNILVMLTVLTLLPAIVLSMTPFVRLLVVFHFLRQALGTQTTPSNQTLIGLSLILTFFLMQPVAGAIHDAAIVPYDTVRLMPWARSIWPAARCATSCSSIRARKTWRYFSIWQSSRNRVARKNCPCAWFYRLT